MLKTDSQYYQLMGCAYWLFLSIEFAFVYKVLIVTMWIWLSISGTPTLVSSRLTLSFFFIYLFIFFLWVLVLILHFLWSWGVCFHRLSIHYYLWRLLALEKGIHCLSLSVSNAYKEAYFVLCKCLNVLVLLLSLTFMKHIWNLLLCLIPLGSMGACLFIEE